MAQIRVKLATALIAAAAILQTSCDSHTRNPAASTIFTMTPPQNIEFKDELHFLEKSGKFHKTTRKLIEKELLTAETLLGVPHALLWCVLFQESRFDPFKNALTEAPAKGLGQFTTSALDEINFDTDTYDTRSGTVLKKQLHPQNMPIDFGLQKTNAEVFPQQSRTSYFHSGTAVLASAVYLNNRYQQLKSALDHQNLNYNPDLLWLYAAAAYNKGARTVFVLLTHEYMENGEEALSELLQNSKSTYAFLTHPETLDSSLSEIWEKRKRTKYLEELLRNMRVISSCALAEPSI